jgi:hypothetical protein
MDDIESQMAASGHLRRLAQVAVEQFQRGDLNAAKRTFGELEAKEELALALLKEAECLDFDEVHEARRLCEEARSFAIEVGSEDLVRRIEQLLDCVRHFTKQAGQPRVTPAITPAVPAKR